MTLNDFEIISRAMRFAAKRHGDQKVPGAGTPYLEHLVRVGWLAYCAALMGGSAVDPVSAAVVGILHDILEDTNATYEEIEREFGREVADAVMALTKPSGIDKRLAMEMSISEMDRPPVGWTKDKIGRYRDEAVMILDALGSASPYLAGMLSERISVYGVPGSGEDRV